MTVTSTLGVGIVYGPQPAITSVYASLLSPDRGIHFRDIYAGQRCASRMVSRPFRAYSHVLYGASPPALRRVAMRAWDRAGLSALSCAVLRALGRASHCALLGAAVARVCTRPRALHVSRLPARICPRGLGGMLRPLLSGISRRLQRATHSAFMRVIVRALTGSAQGAVYRPCMRVSMGGLWGDYRAVHIAVYYAPLRATSTAWCHADDWALSRALWAAHYYAWHTASRRAFIEALSTRDVSRDTGRALAR